MKFSKNKWLAYTFLVGLIPALTRLLSWLVTTKGTVTPLTASDFIALGLVLHISVINEIEHLPSKDKEWKTIQNGTSLIFITLYSALYAATIIGEKNGSLIDGSALLTSSIIFSAISTILSFSVFHRVSKVAKK